MKIVELLSKGMRRIRGALRIPAPVEAPKAAPPADTTAPLVAAPSEVGAQPGLAPVSPAVPANDACVPVAASAPTAGPAASGAVIAKEPGLTCPRCMHRIQVNIAMLLSGGPVICTRCFLHLAVDRERSKESLAALSTLEGQLEEARRMTQR